MKYLPALLLLTFASPALVTPSLAAEKAACETPEAIAIVDGMVCDFCAQGLKKVFMKEPMVKDVAIDLTTKEVRIILKPDETIDDALINKKVDWAGYKVTGITHDCAAK